MLLKLALFSLTESMRKDPSKYSSFIYHNSTSSTADHSGQYYSADSYGQQQYPVQTADSNLDMLIEEAEKLYNKLVKKLVDESISDYDFSTSSSLLPLLPPPEERQSHPATTAAAANQTHMHRIT